MEKVSKEQKETCYLSSSWSPLWFQPNPGMWVNENSKDLKYQRCLFFKSLETTWGKHQIIKVGLLVELYHSLQCCSNEDAQLRTNTDTLNTRIEQQLHMPSTNLRSGNNKLNRISFQKTQNPSGSVTLFKKHSSPSCTIFLHFFQYSSIVGWVGKKKNNQTLFSLQDTWWFSLHRQGWNSAVRYCPLQSTLTIKDYTEIYYLRSTKPF